MSLKKIIGLGTDPYFALISVENRLPFPVHDSIKYKQLMINGPILIHEGNSSYFRFQIEYELNEEVIKPENNSQKARRRPIDEVVAEALGDDPLAPKKQTENPDIEKLIKDEVAKQIQAFFKNWMNEKPV